MKLTRQQRINNIGTQMVQGLTNIATECRQLLSKGIDMPASGAEKELKATGDEVRDSLGDNAKNIEIVCDFVLDGKSNQIVKGAKTKK